MHKKIIGVGLGIALLASPLFASAQTVSATSNASIIAVLEQLVATLTQELQQLIAAQGQSVNVTSPTAPTCSTSVSSNSVNTGQSYTLYWSSTNASYMTGIPTDDQDSPNGSVVIGTYSGPTTGGYTLTFYGSNGQTTTCRTPMVTVNPLSSGAPKLSIGVGPFQTSVSPGTMGAPGGTTQVNPGLSVLIQPDATQSGEDVSISEMPIMFTGNAVDLSNCQIINGSTSLTTGQHVINQLSQGQNIFTLDTPLIVPKGTVLDLYLTCNISSQAQAGDTYQFSMPNGGYSAIGTLSQEPAIVTNTGSVYKATVKGGSSSTQPSAAINPNSLEAQAAGMPFTLTGTATGVESIMLNIGHNGTNYFQSAVVPVTNGTWSVLDRMGLPYPYAYDVSVYGYSDLAGIQPVTISGQEGNTISDGNQLIVPSCDVGQVYAQQVPGYVYSNLFMQVVGLPANVGQTVAITGADTWNSLTFNVTSVSGSTATLEATQTLNSTAVSYILQRESAIVPTSVNGVPVSSCTNGKG